MKHYDDPPKVQKYKNMLMAVAGATGISSGSAHTIAQLLLKGFTAQEFLLLDNVKFGKSEVIDGTACQSVHGRLPQAEVEIALYIDPDTMTMRQLTTRFAEFTSMEIRRNIRLNQPLDGAVFARPNGEI
jgi:hypothetical protein